MRFDRHAPASQQIAIDRPMNLLCFAFAAVQRTIMRAFHPAAFVTRNGMNSTIGLAARIRAFVKWTITPPQAYGAYLVALVLVAGLSFYVGTLKPKRPNGFGPPPMAAPHKGE